MEQHSPFGGGLLYSLADLKQENLRSNNALKINA